MNHRINMKKYVVGAVIMAVVIAGSAFFWYQKTKTVTLTGINDQSSGDPETTTGTYAEILTLGKNVRCDYTSSNGDETTRGTLYIKNRGEGLRGDFTLTQNGATTTSHLIVDKNTEYIWSDNENQGIKVAITDEDRKNIFSETSQESGLTENEKLTCRPASIDQDLLTPAASVTFVNFSEAVPGSE